VGAGRLHVVDVSDPARPELAGAWVGNPLLSLYDVFVSAGFAYVAAGGGGLLVFDVRDPTRPRLFGSYSGGDARSVYVLGHHACVMDRSLGVCVFDVSNPIQPRRTGGNPLVGQLAAAAADLTIVGDKVYALAGEHGLVILERLRERGSLRLEILAQPAPGSFHFILHGPPGTVGHIQRSTDLQLWNDWVPFSLVHPAFEIVDPSAGSRMTQHYRAVSP
jgi:hypothetical protein